MYRKMFYTEFRIAYLDLLLLPLETQKNVDIKFFFKLLSRSR